MGANSIPEFGCVFGHLFGILLLHTERESK